MRTVIPEHSNISDLEFLANEIQDTQERLRECRQWQDIDLDVFWQKYVDIEEKIASARQQLLQNLCDELFEIEVEE